MLSKARFLIAPVAFALIICLVFTGDNVAIVRPEQAKDQLTKVDDRFNAANLKFAFKFYERALKERGDKNVFISPTSIMLALAMTYNGAEGETRRAMANTLGLEGMSLEEVNRAAADLTSALASTDPKVQLKIANSIWAKKGFTLKPAFVQRNQKFYAAEVASLDFASTSAPATINSWVSKNTEGKIEKIVDEISSDAILFLINAIYFKGEWQFSFKKEKTHDDVFRLAGGLQKKLPMMFQSGKFFYQKGENFQAIVLPYGTGRVSMYIFLPDENTALAQFERNITQENWESWMRGFRSTPGDLTLPRFKVDYAADLNGMLKALGMGEAFDPARADFSGIADTLPGTRLYISKVKHKTFAEINEEGTVAAAVTSVEIGVTSAQLPQEPFVMKVDRPFFVAIRDNATGNVLFMGSVVNPG
jgi:serine protease inhibitor